MRAVKSVTIDSERRVIITFLDGSTETLYPNLICCDAEALRDIIKELLEEKADAIVQTVSNVTVATFADGADEALIRKLLVSIEPIQEGTGDPSPENVRPISGRTGISVVRTGKNLLNNTGSTLTTNGVTFTVNDDRTISTTGVATGTAVFRIYLSITDLPKADGFVLNGCPAGGDNVTKYSMMLCNSGGSSLGEIDIGNGATFTASSLSALHQLQIVVRQGADVNGLVFKPMIRIASDTDPIFAPYQGDTYSVSWETEAGTVYSGTLNVISGKLTVTHEGIVLNGSEDWTRVTGNYYYLRLKIGDGRYAVSNVGICDRFTRVPITTTTNNQGFDVYYSSGQDACYIGARYDAIFSAESPDSFKTWLSQNNTTVVYQLSESKEIQITPQEITTLLGANNIWADSGNILELEYVADTKLYIGESQSGTLGSGRQTISNTDLQPVSEKTVEDVSEVVKAETAEKETQEETDDERGE